ncbi:hypothetical protein NDU88_012459 [Pleurodeles waltl]|uniref:Uncharacterized protein n=1 Tax=Pleurodeles waltl TaxID=8319 RepID=A0AAV7R5Z7_PLEWA|nr:hypothetical protein NDU88_012459 [Pleurodeles waltl]
MDLLATTPGKESQGSGKGALKRERSGLCQGQGGAGARAWSSFPRDGTPWRTRRVQSCESGRGSRGAQAIERCVKLVASEASHPEGPRGPHVLRWGGVG